jgi:hypothetical protein
MMTVRELITILRSHDPDIRVVVDGYESSLNDVTPARVYPLRIVLGVGDHSYGGDHEPESEGNYGPDHERVDALLISRRDKGDV